MRRTWSYGANTVQVLPRQGEVAPRSGDGGGGYGELSVCGNAPSTTAYGRGPSARSIMPPA
ncbi:MAG: hypothetical protein EOP68_16025 [Sphingomonas sp.]|nr:MAG: hypothetical protein EOP68_16025 [Sphingomonas sp.]